MRALQRLRDPDADLRQQDRPPRRGPGARAARDRGAAQPGRGRRGTTTRAAGRGARRPRRRAARRLRRRRRAAVAPRGCARALAAQTRRGAGAPGVLRLGAAPARASTALSRAITELLPAAEGDADGPPSGTVFKIERGPAGEKVAYVRMFSGTPCATRDRLARRGEGHRDQRVRGRRVRRAATRWRPGRSASCGASPACGSATRSARRAASDGRAFAPPTLETVVVPGRATDRRALRVALDQLAEQDPLIDVRQDERRALALALRRGAEGGHPGDAGRRLRRRRSSFRETTTICIERLRGAGAAFELIGRGLQPVPRHRRPARRAGAGRERDRVPARGRARLDAARVLQGGRGDACRRRCAAATTAGGCTDCVVTMTHSGYYARQSHSHATFDKSMSSTGGDFRGADADRAGARAARGGHDRARAGASLPARGCRPTRSARCCPLRRAARRRCRSRRCCRGAACVIEGEIPAARVHELRRQLPGLTRGEGVLESEFSRYAASVVEDDPERGAAAGGDRAHPVAHADAVVAALAGVRPHLRREDHERAARRGQHVGAALRARALLHQHELAALVVGAGLDSTVSDLEREVRRRRRGPGAARSSRPRRSAGSAASGAPGPAARQRSSSCSCSGGKASAAPPRRSDQRFATGARWPVEALAQLADRRRERVVEVAVAAVAEAVAGHVDRWSGSARRRTGRRARRTRRRRAAAR